MNVKEDRTVYGSWSFVPEIPNPEQPKPEQPKPEQPKPEQLKPEAPKPVKDNALKSEKAVMPKKCDAVKTVDSSHPEWFVIAALMSSAVLLAGSEKNKISAENKLHEGRIAGKSA